MLNLGGATLDALLCDHQGYVYIDNSFRSPKGGAFDLCIELKNTIAAAYEQARHIPIDFFMDAVKSGDYIINGEYDFTDLVQPTVDSWFRDLLGNVKAQWENYFHRIDRYVVTGGGAVNSGNYDRSNSGNYGRLKRGVRVLLSCGATIASTTTRHDVYPIGATHDTQIEKNGPASTPSLWTDWDQRVQYPSN